jgi:tetratricopeptide (TPR) repeat protein
LDVSGRKDPKLIPVGEAAAEDVDSSLGLAPEDVDVLIAKADAEALLERGDRVHRDRAYDYLQQGLKLQATPGYQSASDAAEFDLLWHLSTLLLSDPKLSDDEKEIAEVEQTIARLRKTRGRPAAADYLEARLLIQKKEWARAATLMERTRPALAAQQAHPDLIGQMDLCLGQCFEALEEWPQAEAAFQRVLAWDPNRQEARAGLGAAQRMLGRYDEALANLVQAADASPTPGSAWLEVARLEILRQLQQDKHDWTRAEGAIDRAAAALPKNSKEAVDPALLRAEILAIQNNIPDAEKLLRDARTAHPDRVEFWTALADLAGRAHDEKRALAILDEAERSLHDRVELRVGRAIHLAVDTTPEHLTALDTLVKQDHSGFSADDQEKLLSGLAEAEIQAGRTADAAGLLEELKRTPAHRADLRLRLTLFDLALRFYDEAKTDAAREERLPNVDQALKDIREVEGDRGAFSELGQALRSTHLARRNPTDSRRSLDDAWAALDRAADLQPNWSAVEFARPDVAELGGDPEGMINHLKEGVRLEQGRAAPTVIQRLVEALNQRGRYAESREYLARLQQSLLVNSPLGKLAAGVALNTGDLNRASELIQTAVQGDTKDFRDLLLRGRLHEAMHQDREAEEDYRKATELAPEQPVVWVAYVLYLGNRGRDAEAATIVKNDVAVKVAKDRAALAVAQCYEVLSRSADASAAYESALTAQPDDPAVMRAVTAYRLRTGRIQEAVPVLDRLVKREVNAPEADVEWAKRALALILSGSTDYRDFRRAVELVGLKLDADGVLQPDPDPNRQESADIRRARARVLATQPQRQFRASAIQLLEGLQSTDPDDQFVLAALYDDDGAETKEADILKHLAALDDHAVKPAYLSQYVQVLLRQGKADRTRYDDAAALIGRLEQLESDRGQGRGAFGSVELRARLLEAQGQGDKALDLLRGYAHRIGAKPEETLMLVASLGRQGRFGDAFDLCEKEDLWIKCSPELVGGLCEAMLRAMPTADKQRDRVEAWLRGAIEKNPKIVVLKMHLADLYDLRGDYLKAATEYREVLKAEPGNIVALNNLAWLLSQQTGQGREALQYIEAAVNGIGRRADLLDTRGSVELALGETQAALADFTEAVNDAPTGTRLFHLARAQYEARDRESAAKTLQKAKADFGLQPSNVHPTEQEVCQTLLNELKVR